jgi:crossover junction endodeoxyribonuclease RuvC
VNGLFTSASRVAIGIDPGAHGAVVVFHDGRPVEIHDTPALEEKSGRPAVNAPLLAALIAKTHATVAFCEFVGARPTDAKTAAFAFGRARGVIEGVCGALTIPVTFIAPVAWKRIAGVAPGAEAKDTARAIAIAKWPHLAEFFARKKDIDRAEAALIGWSALQREARHE